MTIRHDHTKKPAKKKIYMLGWTEDGGRNPKQLFSDALPALKINSKSGVQVLGVTISASASEDEEVLHKLLENTRGYIVVNGS